MLIRRKVKVQTIAIFLVLMLLSLQFGLFGDNAFAAELEQQYVLNKDFEDAKIDGTITEAPEVSRSENTSITIENAASLGITDAGFQNSSDFLKFSDYSTGNASTTLQYDIVKQTGKFVFEFDYFMPVSMNTSRSVRVQVLTANASNNMAADINIFPNKLVGYHNDTGSTVTQTYVPNQSVGAWHNLRLIMDYAAKTYVLFVDGVKIGQYYFRHKNTITEGIDKIKIYGVGCTSLFERTMYIDNMKIFDLVSPQVGAVTVTDKKGNVSEILTGVEPRIEKFEIAFNTTAEIKVDAKSLTEDTITLLCEDTNEHVNFSLGYDEGSEIIAVIPTESFDYEKTYKLSLNGVKDENDMVIPDYSTDITVRAKYLKPIISCDGIATANNTVAAAVKLQNNTAEITEVFVVYTVFADGALERVIQKKVEIEAGEICEEFTMTQTMPNSENISAKIYFWDSLFEMNRLSECYILPTE